MEGYDLRLGRGNEEDRCLQHLVSQLSGRREIGLPFLLQICLFVVVRCGHNYVGRKLPEPQILSSVFPHESTEENNTVSLRQTRTSIRSKSSSQPTAVTICRQSTLYLQMRNFESPFLAPKCIPVVSNPREKLLTYARPSPVHRSGNTAAQRHRTLRARVPPLCPSSGRWNSQAQPWCSLLGALASARPRSVPFLTASPWQQGN